MDDNLPKPEAPLPPTPPTPEEVLQRDSITLLRPVRGLHWAMFGVLGVPAVVYVLGATFYMSPTMYVEDKDLVFGGIFLLYLCGTVIHRRIVMLLSQRPHHGWRLALGLPWIIILIALIGAWWLHEIQSRTFSGGVFQGLADVLTLIFALFPMPAYLILALLSTLLLCRRDIKALFSPSTPTDH